MRELLAGAHADSPLRFSTHVVGHGAHVFEAAGRHGLEGIISKACDAPYVAGRSRTWLKVKHAQGDEFIVVGHSPPKGSRKGFGALLLATVDDGALRYVGRVGSGFDDARLAEIGRRLAKLARDEPVLALPAHVPFNPKSVRWVEYPRLSVALSLGLRVALRFVRSRYRSTRLGLTTPASLAKPPPM